MKTFKHYLEAVHQVPEKTKKFIMVSSSNNKNEDIYWKNKALILLGKSGGKVLKTYDNGRIIFFKSSEDTIPEIIPFRSYDVYNMDWTTFCTYYTLPEDFIRDFKDFVDWNVVSKNVQMSKNFIIEMKDKVNWTQIFKYQKEYRKALRK